MSNETNLEKSYDTALQEALRIDIKGKDEMDKASFLCKGIKLLIAEIDSTFKEPIKAAHEAHKAILKKYNEKVDPLLRAEKLVKTKMGDYLFKQEEARMAEEKRINEEQRLQRAVEAEQAGETKTAEAIINNEVFIPPVILSKEEKPEGVSSRRIPRWRIKDESQIPRSFMIPDDKKINAIVKSMGESAMNVCPGIEIYYETSVTQRIA